MGVGRVERCVRTGRFASVGGCIKIGGNVSVVGRQRVPILRVYPYQPKGKSVRGHVDSFTLHDRIAGHHRQV